MEGVPRKVSRHAGISQTSSNAPTDVAAAAAAADASADDASLGQRTPQHNVGHMLSQQSTEGRLSTEWY